MKWKKVFVSDCVKAWWYWYSSLLCGDAHEWSIFVSLINYNSDETTNTEQTHETGVLLATLRQRVLNGIVSLHLGGVNTKIRTTPAHPASPEGHQDEVIVEVSGTRREEIRYKGRDGGTGATEKDVPPIKTRGQRRPIYLAVDFASILAADPEGQSASHRRARDHVDDRSQSTPLSFRIPAGGWPAFIKIAAGWQ